MQNENISFEAYQNAMHAHVCDRLYSEIQSLKSKIALIQNPEKFKKFMSHCAKNGLLKDPNANLDMLLKEEQSNLSNYIAELTDLQICLCKAISVL